MEKGRDYLPGTTSQKIRAADEMYGDADDIIAADPELSSLNVDIAKRAPSDAMPTSAQESKGPKTTGHGTE